MKRTKIRMLVAVLSLAGIVLAASVGSTSAALPTRVASAKLDPKTALDWNLIAVNTVRSATLSPAKNQIEGTIYMAYVQAAEYNAVTTIAGRYVPYRSSLPQVPGASPRAAVAAAAYTTLSYYFPTLARRSCRRTPTTST